MPDNGATKQRWIVMIQMLFDNREPYTWESGEDGKRFPVTYATKRKAQEEIADVILTKLQQFMDKEREWHEVDFCEDCSIEQCTVDEQGVITSADGKVLYRPFENQDDSRKIKAVTLCDFGDVSRRHVLRKHFSKETAKKAYNKIRSIYYGIHGWRVWQETLPCKIVINDTK
jgi:Na+-transporting NADH:ubiquinone oxidoreductase subunit NqrC